MANPEHLEILKQGVDAWNQWRKENPEMKPDLSEADLAHADLRDALLLDANLSGANLRQADLSGAALTKVDLTGAKLRGADLSGADLTGAHVDNKTDLIGANLTRASLLLVDLSKADLRQADLSEANVTAAKIDRRTRCRGIRAATCYGSPRFKRIANDNDYIEEFRATPSGKYLYWPWLIFFDCGRSFWRWAAWSLLAALTFGVVFHALGEGAFSYNSDLPWSCLKTLYYSVVTFTTLGFGDITPNTQTAAILVMLEVVLGYIMLGALISILADKIARRS